MALVTMSSKILVAVYLFLRFCWTWPEPVNEDCEEDDQVLGNRCLFPGCEAHHLSETDLGWNREECKQRECVVPEAN